MELNMDAELFFNRKPALLPIYYKLAEQIDALGDDIKVKVQKTQISFYNKHLFAAVSLPVRKVKDLPERCLIVTFGLEHQLTDARIWVATEPYPNRWTHHVVVSEPAQVDSQLMAWIEEAYAFSNRK